MKNIIRSRSGSSVIFFDSAFLFYRGFSEEKNNDRDDREDPDATTKTETQRLGTALSFPFYSTEPCNWMVTFLCG